MLLAVPPVAGHSVVHKLGTAHRAAGVDVKPVKLRIVLDVEQWNVAASALVHHVQVVALDIYWSPTMF